MNNLVTDEQILSVIKKYQGQSLTVRKLMELLGYYSTSTVHNRLKKLEKRGAIRKRIIRETIIEVVK